MSFCLIPLLSLGLERSYSFKQERLRYSVDPEYLELVKGNFSGFIADLFYLRGIMAVTDEIASEQLWVRWVQNNFACSLSLDPKLIDSYFFAGIVVGKSRPAIEEGIEFLREYNRLNPSQWQIPYWIGFNFYQLGDYLSAAQFYQEALKLPGAPAFLASNQPMFYYKAGRAELGIAYLEGLLQSVSDSRQLKWIEAKLDWLKRIIFLERKVTEFRILSGNYPESLNDLINYKLIENIPADPFGAGYYWDNNDNRVKSRFYTLSEDGHYPGPGG